MRTKNSLRNIATAMIQIIITVVLRFVAQSYFVHILGVEYQGLNGLFTSIIGMLGISELGLGTAILFNMYGFIADRNVEAIKSLLRFYKWCYHFVASFVLIFGLAVMPFLHFFVNASAFNENVYLIYLLFLADSVVSYLFTYKRSILIAHQKMHVINLADLAYNIIYNVGQIILLILTHNFMLILVLVFFLRLLENIVINSVANRRYPYIKEKKVRKLKASVFHRLVKQMKGQIFHMIGGFVVFGTDSMIISYFLGLGVMGLYTNYLLITNTLSNFMLQIIGSVTPSVGDMLAEQNYSESFKVHQRLSFICFWLYSFASIALYVVMQPFITLWLGHSFLLSNLVLLMIAFNFYVQGMRAPLTVFQQAAGIFYENRFVPVAESIINLVASIICVKLFGLAGVLMGTVLCTMALYGYSFPKYTFVPIFKQKVSVYVKEQLVYLVLFVLMFACTAGLAQILTVISNVWLHFLSAGLLALIVPNVLCYLLFRKTNQFMYFRDLMSRMILRR